MNEQKDGGMIQFLAIEDEGFVWHIPLLKIAENRADYYADDPDTTREEEIEYALSDRGSEALDWYLNNMNFSDISDFAVLVDVPKVKDKPGNDAECDVVELPAARARAMYVPGMQEGV